MCVYIYIYNILFKNSRINISSAHGTFSRTDHILGYKICLNRFKKTEIISSIFSDHNAISLERKCKKHKNVEAKLNATEQEIGHWRNQRGNKKIPGDKWKWKHNDWNLCHRARAVQGGKFTAIQAYMKQEKSQVNNLIIIWRTRKRTNKIQSRRKEIQRSEKK